MAEGGEDAGKEHNFKWLPSCFKILESDSHVKGYVSCEEELTTVLEAHRRFTLCTFVYLHDDGKLREKSERRYFWKNTYLNVENVPYCVKRTIFRQCQYGRRHKRNNEICMTYSNLCSNCRTKARHHNRLCTVKKACKQAPTDHNYKKGRRNAIQPSRKIDCSAKIAIRYFDTFPDYEVEASASRDKKEEKLCELRHDLQSSNKAPTPETKIYISLPLPDAHTNHTVSVLVSQIDSMRKLLEKLKNWWDLELSLFHTYEKH